MNEVQTQTNNNRHQINAPSGFSNQGSGDMLPEHSFPNSRYRKFPTSSPQHHGPPGETWFASGKQTCVPFPQKTEYNGIGALDASGYFFSEYSGEDQRHECGDCLQNFPMIRGTKSKAGYHCKDLFLIQLQHEQDRRKRHIAKGMAGSMPHLRLMQQLSTPRCFLPASLPHCSEFSHSRFAPKEDIDTILHNSTSPMHAFMDRTHPIYPYGTSSTQPLILQENIFRTHHNTEADAVLSTCTDESPVSTSHSPFACTTEGDAHSDSSYKFQSGNRRYPKAQSMQAELNSVVVEGPAEKNKGKQKLDDLEYEHNRTVQTCSVLKSSLLSLAPSVPGAFPCEAVPILWVCNTCGMVAYRSQFERSAHEVKCKASTQNVSLSTGDPNCRKTTDCPETVVGGLHSPAAAHSLHKEKKEALVGPRKIGDHRGRWEARYNQLSEYKKRYGDCCVPQNNPEDPGLGLWVKVQRQSYKLLQAGKQSPLTKERLEKLEKLGFVWDGPLNVRYSKRWKDMKPPPAKRECWNVRFEHLKIFQAQYGHCRVPQRYPVLGLWVKSQRMHYRKLANGKKSSITKKQAQKLESIGFEWRLSKEREAVPSDEKIGQDDNKWDKLYKELCSFKEENGHCSVPYSYPVLSLWVKKQKDFYECLQVESIMDDTAEEKDQGKDGENSSIIEQRRKKLNEIGFFGAVPTNKKSETEARNNS